MIYLCYPCHPWLKRNEFPYLLPSILLRHYCGGDAGARVGRRFERPTGAHVSGRHDRQLDARENEVATSRTLWPRDRAALNSALLCRLANPERDGRTGGAPRRHGPRAPDRLPFSSEAPAS